jgi:hypothetical protein
MLTKSMEWWSNRPLQEVVRQVPLKGRIMVEETFPAIFLAQSLYGVPRYADNTANREAGYVAGEKAVWVAAMTASVPEELRFAWRLELRLADMNCKLNALTGEARHDR